MAATMRRSGGGVGVVFVLVLVALMFGYLAVANMSKASETNEAAGNSVNSNVYVDFTDNEWTAFTNAEYNVDVYIRTGHAAQSHSADEMNAALRTCNEYGTTTVLSENITRRLHLLCKNKDTGKEYVVIIQKIKRAVDSFQNATSELVTAFELKEGALQPTIASYIYGTVDVSKAAIIVKLCFEAGELFFSPYK